MGRKIPLWHVLFVLIFMVVTLMADILIMDGYIHGILSMVLLVTVIVAMLNGWKWSYIQKAMMSKISDSMEAILIFITVGMMVAMWISGGIVQTLIYYGLKVLNPRIFLIGACLLSFVVSMATGSSWTTAGTVGVALVGIGTTLGVPAGMVGGAIISGAYAGDKMSPLSDTTNLAPAMAGSTLFEHIGHMMYTIIPTALFSLAAYAILGLTIPVSDTVSSDVEVLSNVLVENFNITPLLLIVPVIIVVLAVKKMPALATIFIGALLGLICVPLFQGRNFMEAVCYELYEGYVSTTGNEFIDALLTRGGIESMFYSTSLCLIALAFAGVLDGTGMLAVLCEKLMKIARSNGMLILITLLTCIGVNLTCADQYLGIVLPGAMYKEEYQNRRLKAKNLSRCLEDAGTLSSPLIPWTTCSAYMIGALGISPIVYAPFAFVCWICPIISAIYGFTGFSIEKMSDEEYEKMMAARAAEKAAAEKLQEA
ncbi:MAG: Na+/H+ antiporter NhaC [Clostridiales bacterium]|nr:Na+/H+ antiporter NhaC [Clostridiales bacterium]